jgi:hypothetical protein
MCDCGSGCLALDVTTAIALASVLNGKILQHRRWMTRSYAVAIVFLKVRAIPGVRRMAYKRRKNHHNLQNLHTKLGPK